MITARLFQALEFAAQKHVAQRRKSGAGVPYINHPITVARLLAEAEVVDENALMAALLHDTLEDTATTREELASCFGPTVCRLVEEVTDVKGLPDGEAKRRQVAAAGGLSAGAVLVRLADKIANVRDLSKSPPTDWSLERVVRYLDWAAEVVAALPKSNAALEALFAEAVREGRRALSDAAS